MTARKPSCATLTIAHLTGDEATKRLAFAEAVARLLAVDDQVAAIVRAAAPAGDPQPPSEWRGAATEWCSRILGPLGVRIDMRQNTLEPRMGLRLCVPAGTTREQWPDDTIAKIQVTPTRAFGAIAAEIRNRLLGPHLAKAFEVARGNEANRQTERDQEAMMIELAGRVRSAALRSIGGSEAPLFYAHLGSPSVSVTARAWLGRTVKLELTGVPADKAARILALLDEA